MVDSFCDQVHYLQDASTLSCNDSRCCKNCPCVKAGKACSVCQARNRHTQINPHSHPKPSPWAVTHKFHPLPQVHWWGGSNGGAWKLVQSNAHHRTRHWSRPGPPSTCWDPPACKPHANPEFSWMRGRSVSRSGEEEVFQDSSWECWKIPRKLTSLAFSSTCHQLRTRIHSTAGSYDRSASRT